MAIIQDRTSQLFTRLQRLADRVVSPDTRNQVYTNISTFSREQPLLASFLLIQLILSFTPVALFASFAIGTILVSFITALLFSLFWIGAALLVLVPVLFITTSLGIAIWFWAVGTYIVSRWAYSLVPVSVRGGVEVDMPNGQKMVVKKSGEGYGDVEAKVKPVVPNKIVI